MSNIPLARDMIAAVRAELVTAAPDAAARLDEAMVLMHRRPMAKPRAAPSSQPITAELAMAIRLFVAARPGISVAEVARIFETNQGRVSEALQRDR